MNHYTVSIVDGDSEPIWSVEVSQVNLGNLLKVLTVGKFRRGGRIEVLPECPHGDSEASS